MANKKNGGFIPPLPLIYDKETDTIKKDKRVLLVPVGCGKCMECQKQRSRNWSQRLKEEIKISKKGKFVTLTFEDEQIKNIKEGKDLNGKQVAEPLKLQGYELDNEIATIAIRRFLENWRKKYKKSIRHWLVTELGGNGTENIHIHGVMWSEKTADEIKKMWKYGFSDIKDETNGGYVNEKTINYITKYVTKTDTKHPNYNPKVLTSGGIGKKYIETRKAKLNKYKDTETDELYKDSAGFRTALCTYYRNKIYTEKEREELWLNKLDKNERYVNGKLCKTDEEYYRQLHHARQLNKELKYGDNKKNWDKIQYENQRRNILTLERIQRAEKLK